MKIGFLGDIGLIGQYDVQNNDKFEKKLEFMKIYLQQFDYVIGNLESPLTDYLKTRIHKSMHLRSCENSVQILKYLGVNAVSLANNHIFDYGIKGLTDTIRVLEKNKIKWYGVNNKSIDLNFDNNNVSISGFCCYSTNGFGYSNGLNVMTKDNILKQLKNDQNNKKLSIMSLHMGKEHTQFPAIEHINFFNDISKKYDFIVHGHHTHCIQGIKKYNRSLVSYSLGNFLFDDCISIDRKLTVRRNCFNKQIMVLCVEVENNVIIDYSYDVFYDDYDKFKKIDLKDTISDISNKLDIPIDIESYNLIRKKQIEQIQMDKFGKHDIGWVIKKLNFNSIFARLDRIKNENQYKKIWLNNITQERNI